MDPTEAGSQLAQIAFLPFSSHIATIFHRINLAVLQGNAQIILIGTKEEWSWYPDRRVPPHKG